MGTIKESRPQGTTSQATGPQAPQRGMKRVAFASLVGSLIEFYDYTIYATAAALVFPKVFFPGLGSNAGIVASYATLAAAFIARPFGGILFGHLGDRIGRKKTLIATLLLMGIATGLIGLLPSASLIGWVAPVALVALRVMQGLSAGGEWAGANLFAAEHAPMEKRGFWASFPQLSIFSLSMASGTFLITDLTMSDEQFLSWGWRIPFLASFVLVLVGLYARKAVDETPIFARSASNDKLAKLPLWAALKSQPWRILIAGGAGLTVFAYFYLGITFLATYATKNLHMSSNSVLAAGFFGGVIMTAAVVVGGALSDRIGRTAVIGWTSAVGAVWALALFPILNAVGSGGYPVVLSISLLIAGMSYGPLGAFISELFGAQFRYTATGLSYNIASIIGGGLTPIAASSLNTNIGSNAVGVYVAILCAVGAGSVFALKRASVRGRETYTQTPT